VKTVAESNAVLKLKFQKLHSTVVNSVTAADVIDFLFQEEVLSQQEMRDLQPKSDRRQQCRDLLALLHTSEHPQAFVKLYLAIKNEPHLQWLIDRIDQYTDQSVTNLLLEQTYISEPTSMMFDCWNKVQNYVTKEDS